MANRGEIALRIIRTCHEMGIETVAVHSDADDGAMHTLVATRAVRIGPPDPALSYLDGDRIIAAAVAEGADAIHPGYGFLAERASFARAAVLAGLTFIGPPSDTIDALGDKLAARRIAAEAGVPVVPGTLEPADASSPDELDRLTLEAERIGFPLLVKAAAGGGGRGMRRVTDAAELPGALAAGSAEAAAAFGDGSVYLEREVRPARHIEVQLLGDAHGSVVALGERDCSIQRRHQKLVEEAPAPGLTRAERAGLHALAVRLGSAAGLTNAATAEFLRAPDGAFLFLEVNTRLQVEHGVTELMTGLDLVREQLWLAAGAPLSDGVRRAATRAARPEGHAIEVRITAEHPGRDFAPTPGRITRWRMPSGPGVRVDAGVGEGDRVPQEYDNLVAKLMVHGADRNAAIDRLRRALDETEIGGIQTTVPFHRFVARSPAFREGRLSTEWVAEQWDGPTAWAEAVGRARLAAGLLAMDAATAPASGPGSDGSHPNQRTSLERPPASSGRWRAVAREDAIDRWPR